MTELAKQDQEIEELQCEINHRKQLLAKKLSVLSETSNINKFLSEVVEDYKEYNRYILKDKENQEKAMKNILDHLDAIIKEDDLTTESISHVKLQQKEILEELTKVKDNLQEILSASDI